MMKQYCANILDEVLHELCVALNHYHFHHQDLYFCQVQFSKWAVLNLDLSHLTQGSNLSRIIMFFNLFL